MAEAAGGKTQHQEGNGGAEAGRDPGQGHGEHSWEENPWAEDKHTVTGKRPQAPHPIPSPTSVLTDGSEQFPDDNESEEFPGEETICQEASQESAHEGDTEHQG